MVSILQHAIYDLSPTDDEYAGTITPFFDNLQNIINDYASGQPSQSTIDFVNQMVALAYQYDVDGGGRVTDSAAQGIAPMSRAGDYATAAAVTAGWVALLGAAIVGAPLILTVGAAMAVAGVVVYTIAALNPNLPDNPEATAVADGFEASGFFGGAAATLLRNYVPPAASIGLGLSGGLLGWIKYKIAHSSTPHTYPWSNRWGNTDSSGNFNWSFFNFNFGDGFGQDTGCGGAGQLPGGAPGTCGRIQATPTPSPRNVQPQ